MLDVKEVVETVEEFDAARPPLSTPDWRFAVKHAIDRVLALLMLLVLAPVLLAIALTVRLSSPGPVLFRQRRVGRGGRVFELYKFRTMLGEANNAGFTLPDGVGPGGVEGADRRTGVGRWLRASSLDELPQFFNVVRGEMSLIGPRPERPEFAERFAAEVPGYVDRQRVKCGITGWAQANGLRGQTSIEDRAAYDNYYIDNWSMGLELRTLVLTVVEVLRFREGRGLTSRRAGLTSRSRGAQPEARAATAG
jgi:lipopolysaccharide/colanic/teichoic acid biosynthesis glycosyltransferase